MPQGPEPESSENSHGLPTRWNGGWEELNVLEAAVNARPMRPAIRSAVSILVISGTSNSFMMSSIGVVIW